MILCLLCINTTIETATFLHISRPGAQGHGSGPKRPRRAHPPARNSGKQSTA